MNSMAHSAGSAEAEMSIIVDSIDYKLNKLHETGTGIAQNLFQREDMKSVIDVVTSLANGIDFLTNKLGLFGTVATGFAGYGIVSIVRNFSKSNLRIIKTLLQFLIGKS